MGEGHRDNGDSAPAVPPVNSEDACHHSQKSPACRGRGAMNKSLWEISTLFWHNIGLLNVFSHVCVCGVHVCLHRYLGSHGGPKLLLRSFLNCSLLNYRVSQLDPELAYMTSPANQIVLRIPISAF